jgi:myosin heavy subunit
VHPLKLDPCIIWDSLLQEYGGERVEILINQFLLFAGKFHSNMKAVQYIKPKSDVLRFAIKHYAGLVEYEAQNFLEKNRDRLAIEIVNILRLSDIQLVRTLFQNPLSKTGTSCL